MTTTLPASPPDDLHRAIFTARDAAHALRIDAVSACDAAAVLAAAEADANGTPIPNHHPNGDPR